VSPASVSAQTNADKPSAAIVRNTSRIPTSVREDETPLVFGLLAEPETLGGVQRQGASGDSPGEGEEGAEV
jgi:hypothetical protein